MSAERLARHLRATRLLCTVLRSIDGYRGSAYPVRLLCVDNDPSIFRRCQSFQEAEGAAKARSEQGHFADGCSVRGAVIAPTVRRQRQGKPSQGSQNAPDGAAFPVLIADLLPSAVRDHH